MQPALWLCREDAFADNRAPSATPSTARKGRRGVERTKAVATPGEPTTASASVLLKGKVEVKRAGDPPVQFNSR